MKNMKPPFQSNLLIIFLFIVNILQLPASAVKGLRERVNLTPKMSSHIFLENFIEIRQVV